jgi:AAA+ superfamily predicted ATPase
MLKEGFRVYLPDEEILTEDINELLGLEDAKKQLIRLIKTIQKDNVEQLNEWEIKAGGTVLIIGLLGMGKTSLVRALAKKERLPLVEMNIANLLITFPNPADIKLILNRLRTVVKDVGPCIILLDDFEPTDLFTNNDIEDIRRTIYQFIKEFDIIYENDPRLLIAIISYPIKDEALLNFFDHQVIINEIDETVRHSILKKYLEKTNIDPSIDFENLLHIYSSDELTNGFSGEDLKRFVQGAAFQAIYDNRKEIIEKDLKESYQQLINTNRDDLKIDSKMSSKKDKDEDFGSTQKLEVLENEVDRLRWMIHATSQMLHNALRLAFSDNREFVVRVFERFEKDRRPYALYEIAHVTGLDEDAVKKVLAKKYFAMLFPKLGKKGRVAAFDRELLDKVADEFTFVNSKP